MSRILFKRMMIAVAIACLGALSVSGQDYEKNRSVIIYNGLELASELDGEYEFGYETDLAFTEDNVDHDIEGKFTQTFHSFTLVQDLELDDYYYRLHWAGFDDDGDLNLVFLHETQDFAELLTMENDLPETEMSCGLGDFK